jgi:hypothetical protein
MRGAGLVALLKSSRRRSSVRPFIALLLAALVVAGCQILGGVMPGRDQSQPHPYPAGCALFDLSARRCTLIVEELARDNGISVSDATSIDLLGDPGCLDDDGRSHPCVRTTAFVVRARFTLASGAPLEGSMFCGTPYDRYTIMCTERPEIQLVLPIQNGYGGAACNEDPAGITVPPDEIANQTPRATCQAPFPSPDPSTAAAEQPLVVASMDVPIDHVGAYSVPLGRGTLANGLLEETSMSASDANPLSFFLRGPVWLDLTSLKAGGRPFDDYLMHGRVEGTEPFSARLTFEVMAFDPGALLQIRDVVIR